MPLPVVPAAEKGNMLIPVFEQRLPHGIKQASSLSASGAAPLSVRPHGPCAFRAPFPVMTLPAVPGGQEGAYGIQASRPGRQDTPEGVNRPQGGTPSAKGRQGRGAYIHRGRRKAPPAQ